MLVTFLLAGGAMGCGYRVAGQASRLPARVRVIGIPAFTNQTTWMGIEQRLTAAVMQEFIQRTRYQVIGTGEGADAVLTGTVREVRSRPVVFDPDTGRASATQVEVRLSVELRERGTDEVLYSNPNFLFREQYEVTSDLDSFFEERGPALDRLARDFAATLVSAVLENF